MSLRFGVIGLRVHAVLVSMSLILLTGILGLRAHSVARSQVEETRKLLNHDLAAQTLMVRLESYLASLEQVRRKFSVTHDSQYLGLEVHYDDAVRVTRQALASALESLYPDESRAAQTVLSADAVRELKKTLEARREKRLKAAQYSAQGLLRLILLALALSVGITAWLLLLFFRELLDPLKKIRAATAGIGFGDFNVRLVPTSGVAELRELSLSFNAMAERLASLEKAKSDFLATVSHEIKNPLAALKEGLSLLAEHGETLSPAARNRGFCACLIASKRLESMINNLLSLSSGVGGMFDCNVAPRAIECALQTAMDEVRPLAGKKGMDFCVAGDVAKKAVYDKDAVVQVFENLFMNAIKYGHENSVIEVTVEEKREDKLGARLAISVASKSRPIPQAELSKIFDRFYRGSNSASHQGLGIGLHVVKKIVEAHHGGVSAQTDPSGRITFGFWMPSYGDERGRA